MRIKYSPIRDDQKITYTFANETITCEINGVQDVFDLSTFPEGAEFQGVETLLTVNPIVSVRREAGILHVELLAFIPKDASQQERFPVWVEV